MRIFGAAVLIFSATTPLSAVQEFDENFNGGVFSSTGATELNGFQVPDWQLDGSCGEDLLCSNSMQDVEFRNGGLMLQNTGNPFGEADFLHRTVLGPGSFFETLYIDDVVLTSVDSSGNGALGLEHTFATDLPGRNEASITLSEFDRNTDEWLMLMRFGSQTRTLEVPSGSNVRLGISFDETVPSVTFAFDNDSSDAESTILQGPFVFDGRVSQNQSTLFFASAIDTAQADGRLDAWSLASTSIVKGDFNRNGGLDAGDIDLLSAEVRERTHDRSFDLNDDRLVNSLDRAVWVQELTKTWFGDANLNSQFNSQDLVEVFSVGEYDDNVPGNSTWSTGDWNGDGEFNSSDFVLAFQDAGFENGPRPRATLVPEPIIAPFAAVFWWTAILSVVHALRRTDGKR